ncbi:hypothetical protein B0H11DRAFT_2024506 [Mycena galericulata]|nr:hypothetical protein B0H11DRAFT_2024506 [Mycena galericulata]
MFALAGQDPAGQGLAIPNSMPYDSTYATSSAHGLQPSVPDYANAVAYPHPAQPTYTSYPDLYFPDYDYASLYAGTAPAQNTMLPPSTAFYPEDPSMFLPFPQSSYIAEEVMFSTPLLPEDYHASAALSQDDVNIQLTTTAMSTSQFNPALPANLPMFPAAPGGEILPLEYSQQQGYPAAHASASPHPTAYAGQDASRRQTRKRPATEQVISLQPQKKRMKRSAEKYVSFAEKYPEINALMSSFQIISPPPTVGNIAGPSSSQLIPSPSPSEPVHGQGGAPRVSEQPAQKPEPLPHLLFQVPPKDMLHVLYDGRPYTDEFMVDSKKAEMRIQHMVFGEKNALVGWGRPHAQKLYEREWCTGDKLKKLCEEEGSGFWGNELYDPQTGERWVLRLSKKQVAADGHTQPLSPLPSQNTVHNDAEIPVIDPIHLPVNPESIPAPTPELDVHHSSQQSTPATSSIEEIPAVQDEASIESTPVSTPGLDMHDSRGTTPVSSRQTTPQSPHQAPTSDLDDWSKDFPVYRPGNLELDPEILLPDDFMSWCDL